MATLVSSPAALTHLGPEIPFELDQQEMWLVLSPFESHSISPSPSSP